MSSIYLHIPFCKTRCIYCDFYSSANLQRIRDYTQALINELILRAEYLPKGEPVRSIYFGGGTPSILPLEMLRKIVRCIFQTYNISHDAEITIEANPDDITPELLDSLFRLQFNRISLGVQTFSDPILHFLNRRHDADCARNAVRECRKKGFKNISIDLMYALPQQTLPIWQQDIDAALALDVPHISAYALTFEQGTRLWQLREEGHISETEENLSLSMYQTLIERLVSAGYQHYELSNFAIPNFQSRHNSGYWNGIKYLGCGPSAHSFDGASRQYNKPNISLYINRVINCRCANDFTDADWIEREQLTPQQQYNDYIITAIRTSEGIDIATLNKRFSSDKTDYCLQMASPHIRRGTLQVTPPTEQSPLGRLKLTKPGLFISDGIMSDLLIV